MAEFDIAKKIGDEVVEIETTDVMTGDRDRNRLYYLHGRENILWQAV